MNPSETMRPKELEKENIHLKKLVVDQALDNQILKEDPKGGELKEDPKGGEQKKHLSLARRRKAICRCLYSPSCREQIFSKTGLLALPILGNTHSPALMGLDPTTTPLHSDYASPMGRV
jgi:hypothetical protein